MATYSQSNFSSGMYSKYRPTYPTIFLDHIIRYHDALPNNNTGKLLEIGSGPGEASIPLIPYFEKVVMTDKSPGMLDQARINIKKLNFGDRVTFSATPAEEISKLVPEESVDVIIAAECAHWLDYSKWFEECLTVLKPNGTLCYFSYVVPIFINVLESSDSDEEKLRQVKLANEVFQEFNVGDKWLGSYWEQPGFGRLQGMNSELNKALVADDRWANVTCGYRIPSPEENYFQAETDSDEFGTDCFIMQKDMTLKDVFHYIETWSARHVWNSKHSENEKAEDLFMGMIKEKVGWNEETLIDVSFKTVYTLARKYPK